MWQSILAFSLLLATVPAFPQQGGAAAPFMKPEELCRGMRGEGRTVFQGTAIEPFSAEILGVLPNALGPRQDLILARLSGGPLEEAGVIRGMSGSPVYVEGRLIGAVAYLLSPFAKTPICGITPIHQMLQVLDGGMEPAPQEQSWAPAFPRPATEAGADPELAGAELVPLATPVWLAGFTPAAARLLDERLRPFGLQVHSGPAGQAPADLQIAIEPGAALGVQLLGGDLSATAIGTATYVDGARVVAFGHPLMMAGATDLPMTGAYIHDIVPSQMVSFKLGAATRPVGAIRQDRAAAIAGLVGPAPAMLPAQVEIRLQSGKSEFHFEVLRHPELTPGLTLAALLGALESTAKLGGAATVQTRSRLGLAGGRAVEQEQVHSGPEAILEAALAAVAPLEALSRAPFAGLQVEEIRFEVELREQLETARVSALRVADPVVRPGQSFACAVTLLPYRREQVEQRVELALPPTVPPGPLTLRVGSGAASRAWESQRRPDSFQPRDAAQLLELLAQRERDDELVVELYRPEPGLTLDGRELPGLPPSARAILEQGRSAGRVGPVQGRVLLRQRLRTAYVLSGEQTLELTVRRP